jgi:hypothetical protein
MVAGFASGVACRAELSDNHCMRSAELLRRLRRLATKRGWELTEREAQAII